MSEVKLVKDIMLGAFEFPHIPYWFSIEQSIKVVKASFIQTQKYSEPLAMLVFDEKYNLLGIVTIKDILKGLEPELLKTAFKIQDEKTTNLSICWNSLFKQESKKLLQKPVSDIMRATKNFVEPNDPVEKAAFIMIYYNLPLLPVIEENKKFVGIVRMIELFDAISEEIIKE
ncbi:MAG TPA: CBS domain-containing protein [Thermodesulfovibrio thiophilus]|nr:CBS domain-containing protein [Thermodesulfovibrio thiophilus]HQA04085.1 CBS domain-containing protein [Thermodesulfovibrio thiophilus]